MSIENITIIIGLLCMMYSFAVEFQSGYEEARVPARAAIALGIGIACVLAGIGVARADDWTTGDTWRAASFQGLCAIDALQTHNVPEHPDKWREQNNFLGSHPTMGAKF